MKVMYDEDVKVQLRELVDVLYNKGYFGFKESAYRYVSSLIDNINDTIALRKKNPAPKYFSKHRENLYYTAFRKNRNTVWYVFFNYEDDVYYIRYIDNNHRISQYL
jgi:hypothetical protein